MIDISLNSDLFVNDKIDAAVQELDLLFNTENTELLGYTDYGTNWWQYLWTLTSTATDLRAYIIDKIAETYFASQFNPIVEVEYQQGTENSIYYVKISLTDPQTGDTVTTQQYTLK